MSYKAQLVVRARSKEGAAIIEKVKEMASDRGATYSEMAVELLGRGLNADDALDSIIEADDEEEEEEEEAETDSASPAPVIEEAPAPAPPAKEVPEHPRAPLPAEEAGPAVDPELPPEEIIEAYLARREDRGERAAGRILVDFFAEAGPAEGGQLKKLLQKEFSDQDYETLMEPIKETEEYSTYTERAIFGAPSPYSQVN